MMNLAKRYFRKAKILFYKLVVGILQIKVRENRIVFISWGGRQYSCNPRSFFEYIVGQPQYNFEIYWAELDELKIPTQYENKCKRVKIGTFNYYRIYKSSKFIVFNTRMTGDAYMNKVKSQIFIQTWHGTALKRLGYDSTNISYKVSKIIENEMNNLDIILSGSRFMSNVFRSAYHFKGTLLEIGTPRNDVFFRIDDNMKEFIFSTIGIKSSQSIVLYAPTFRDNGDIKCYDIDAPRVLSVLKHRFPEREWVFAYRFHPKIKETMQRHIYSKLTYNIIDLTSYPNMEDLLRIVDILITDYSSSIFDFSLTRRPAFILASDVKFYSRGFYMDIQKLPFPFATSTQELCYNIENLNETDYSNDILNYMENVLGSFESGKAAEELFKWIKGIHSIT